MHPTGSNATADSTDYTSLHVLYRVYLLSAFAQSSFHLSGLNSRYDLHRRRPARDQPHRSFAGDVIDHSDVAKLHPLGFT